MIGVLDAAAAVGGIWVLVLALVVWMGRTGA